MIEQPNDIEVVDENDMETRINDDYATTKAEYIIHYGREVRCLNRGHVIR